MASQKIDTTTEIALDPKSEGTSITVLQSVLADTIFLQSLYKKYHWHVAGEGFYQYHLLFDKHAVELFALADVIAERIRTVGGRAPGMPDEVARNKTADEGKDPGHDAQMMLANLLNVHRSSIKNVRSAVAICEKSKDEGTVDMLVGQALRLHELQTWFIRSGVSPQPAA